MRVVALIITPECSYPTLHFMLFYYTTICITMISIIASFKSLRYLHSFRTVGSFRTPSVVNREASLTHKDVSIPLNFEERKFFETLSGMVRDKKLGTTVRVAGGWVRDKLLGLPVSAGNVDIDVALDNITGTHFVEILNEWLQSQGIQSIRFNVIKQNPDKSKHLETVHLSFGNITADLVNLRTESYCETSRIPKVQLGTPTEDAYRRDLTINTLFYNIHTKYIEDFTGIGLLDLQQKIIRTPLPSLITLTDDPLRALRAIRFACRFNFSISSELMQACQNPTVITALLQKVSRERILHELELMAKTKFFARAMYLFHTLGMFRALVTLPPDVISGSKIFLKQTEPHANFSLLQNFHNKGVLAMLMFTYTARCFGGLDIIGKVLKNTSFDEDGRLSFFFALMTMELGGNFTKPEIRSISLVGSILKHDLKMSLKQAQDANRVADSCDLFVRFVEEILFEYDKTLQFDYAMTQVPTKLRFGDDTVLAPKCGPVNGLSLGLAIDTAGKVYPQVIIAACLQITLARTAKLYFANSLSQPTTEEYSQLVDILMEEAAAACFIDKNGALVDTTKPLSTEKKAPIFKIYLKELKKVLKAGNALLTTIDLLHLTNDWEKPFLLNGNRIKLLFPSVQGELIGKILATQKEWMICNPTGTIEDLSNFLLTVHFPQQNFNVTSTSPKN